MSPDTHLLIAEHRARLRRLVDDHRDLLTRLQDEAPSLVEREAVATVLHSFYTGVEFIMRSVSDEYNGGVIRSGAWHASLLASMKMPTDLRPALLSPSTAATLSEYMVFRHRFRNIYSFDLDWDMMRPLVLNLATTLQALDADLDRFLQ